MASQMSMNFGYETYFKASRAIIAQIMPLMSLVDKYEEDLLKIPEYQRPHVWDAKRKKDWAKAIREHITIPSFFTYDIKGNGITYLADGCQRLFTTIEILREPQLYEFASLEEVRYHLHRCNVAVVYMSCESHDEGYSHFVNLNSKGTVLTPADIYKGLMIKEDRTSISAWVYENVNEWMKGRLSIVTKLKGVKPTAKDRNLEIRDNLALLYQYLSGTDTRGFWHVASPVAKSGVTPVEKLLAEFLEQAGRDNVEKDINSFLAFISQSIQLIREGLDEKYGKAGHTISRGLTRHLLHFCIYCRNTKYPNKYKIAYVKGVIKASIDGNSRLLFMDGDNKPFMPNAHTDSLSKVIGTCTALGIPWDRVSAKRSRNKLLNGLENSHIEPFSENGDGETFPEPAPLNRARGAKPIKDDEPQSH